MKYRHPIQVLAERVKQHPDKDFLHQPINRQWHVTSWQQAFEKAQKIATGLNALGLQKGDRVAILSKNCAEWFIADYAIMMAGMVSVPIYYTANQKTIAQVVENSGAKAVFVGKLDEFAPAEGALGDEIQKVAFPYPTIACQHQWNDWLDNNDPLSDIHEPKPEETMTLVYTSGSTGIPKGVVISYLNYSSVCETHIQSFEIANNDRALSYLPLAHITERGVIQGPGMYAGASIYFVESLDTFLEDLKHCQPTLFISVPRLWTKFQTGVFEKLPPKKLEKLLKIPLIGRLLAKKIRQGIGIDSARIYGSGSAPISKSTLEWYQTIGVDIAEGWGMTEVTGLACSNFPFNPERIGTIGLPCACVEMKLSPEGEILIRGDAVFEGYYQNQSATDESFQDGWFKTGDKGEILANGSYQIIGRMKEEFKTSKGKYVAPAPIESMLAANPAIEQICVMGAGRKQPVAVAVLAAHLLGADKDQIRKSLRKTLEKVNADLESHQKLDCLIVADEAWSVENDFLTPTLKIRRSMLEKKYNKVVQDTINELVFWENDVTASEST
ncbi:AMP-binding protein [Aliikangiella marina]|uniref:AMP-binding protein n=1 Tax=Aliikangiella marina TaxID=1712262 RepID=A0A545TE34_9GAMM|nr:AMP-binding protein [Aliikangiella marina]TQV75474.1 AMP-binding protein [Aliikangiella marina]